MRHLHTSRLMAALPLAELATALCVCQNMSTQKKVKNKKVTAVLKKKNSNEGDNSFCVPELLGQPTSHVH